MPNPPPAIDPLSTDELLALWAQARALALPGCARSLARLRAGQGGFYQEDDLWQDLFLEFLDLARAWRTNGSDQAALWDAWRRRLCRSGARILRRRPQRLWARPERPTDPHRLALLGEDPAGPADLSTDALAQAAQALSALGPVQRQMIYMTGLAGLSAAQVAQDLGLPGAGAVHRRVLLARRALSAPARLEPQPLDASPGLGADLLLAALEQERRHLSGLVASGYSLKEAARWLAAWQGLR